VQHGVREARVVTLRRHHPPRHLDRILIINQRHAVHALRYYERAGLVVIAVDRTAAGRRRYQQLELDWIAVCPSALACTLPKGRHSQCGHPATEDQCSGPGNTLARGVSASSRLGR
jgi:hypothetical protein